MPALSSSLALRCLLGNSRGRIEMWKNVVDESVAHIFEKYFVKAMIFSSEGLILLF